VEITRVASIDALCERLAVVERDDVARRRDCQKEPARVAERPITGMLKTRLRV
jgi:hypothetical protein